MAKRNATYISLFPFITLDDVSGKMISYIKRALTNHRLKEPRDNHMGEYSIIGNKLNYATVFRGIVSKKASQKLAF